MKINYPRKSWYWQNISNACTAWKHYRKRDNESLKESAFKWLKVARMFRKRPV